MNTSQRNALGTSRSRENKGGISFPLIVMYLTGLCLIALNLKNYLLN